MRGIKEKIKMVAINTNLGGAAPYQPLNTPNSVKTGSRNINFNKSVSQSTDADSASSVGALSTQEAPKSKKKELSASSDFEKEFLKQCGEHFGFMTIMGR